MSESKQGPAIVGAAKEAHSYDAIVIGSGISGGWAAKELCEKGLQTLVLERGRDVEHIKDYTTAHLEAWQMPMRGEMSADFRKANPTLSRCYAVSQATEQFFVPDSAHPWEQKKPFDWVRGYQVGGKSLMWARWVQRWSEFDFESNLKNGVGVDWPIRYGDLAPWYSYVEKFAGISGNRDGLPQIPDGEFLPPMEMNAGEKHFKQAIEKHFPGRHLVISRTANLSRAHNGRGPCLYRSRCARGCPFGGYFSSNSTTLPAAAATGNLTMRPHSVVHSIIYDEKQLRATGVRVVDAETLETTEYYAKIIFVNAATLNTTLILKNSTSNRFPNGLGNDSGVLGHYLMDHNYRGRLSAKIDGMEDKYYFGRRPTGTYLPRFRNIFDDKQDYVGGFAYSVGAYRNQGNLQPGDAPFGAEFKEKMTEVGPWGIYMTGMGEFLPDYDNKVTLSKTRKDRWGMPILEIACDYKQNEELMTADILTSGAEMLERAGYKDIRAEDNKQAPGLAIHEMGTARMGRDPKTSILNGHNQMHAVPNVFVTDGSCMTSSACQNPSLTYMALTARAVDYAVSELKKRNI
jgi:choline dehydrogenase-like flavoprotein